MRRAICATAVLLAVSCAADPEPAVPAPTTTTAVVTTTTLSESEIEERVAAAAEAKQLVKEMNRTPSWCSHYDAWKRAVDEQDEIAARYGSKGTKWPSHVLERYDRAFAAQMDSADRLWDGTEAGTVPRGWEARARACR